MNRPFDASEQLNELFAALAKAQGEFNTAKKSSINTHWASTYAGYNEVVKAAKQALSANGLSVSHDVKPLPEYDVLVTILGHSSGQWKEIRRKKLYTKADLAEELGVSYVTLMRCDKKSPKLSRKVLRKIRDFVKEYS